MVWVKPPKIASVIFKDVIWQMPKTSKKIYLTFDDGPTPDVTLWVISILNKYNAKATFFCVGNNTDKYPEIIKEIIKAGHTIGNHTNNHLNGWKTDNDNYFSNIETANKLLSTNIFRPPYGRIKPSQIKYLKKYYKIIMWNVLSGDYNNKLSPEQCLDNVINNIEAGAIIVFHDSKKSEKNLKIILPEIMDFINDKGFICSGL